MERINSEIIGKHNHISIYAIPNEDALFNLIKVYGNYTIAVVYKDGHIDTIKVDSKNIGKPDAISNNVRTNTNIRGNALGSAIAIYIFSGNII